MGKGATSLETNKQDLFKKLLRQINWENKHGFEEVFTNAEIQKVEVLDYEDYAEMLDREALKEFDINPLTSECKDCDILLISKLCIKGLSNIAQGTCTTKAENFALEMLLKGKKVYILEDGIEYRKYKNTAPKVLYNKYIKFEEELLAYGIEVIDDLNRISIESKDEKCSLLLSNRFAVLENL